MASRVGSDGVDVGFVAQKTDCFVDGGLVDEGWVVGEEGSGDGGAEIHRGMEACWSVVAIYEVGQNHTGEVLQGYIPHDLRNCQHGGLRARGDEYPKISGARGLGRWVLCWDTDPNTVSVIKDYDKRGRMQCYRWNFSVSRLFFTLSGRK